MAQNWAICIGINHYNFCPDLSFAVNDATQMAAWLAEQAGFQTYVFTDDSEEITDMSSPMSSRPTFTTLRRWLRKRFPENQPCLKPDDSLWFFFSGHGIREQGQDYLLLSDSDPDPEEVDNSALSLADVTEYLRRSGAGNIMMFVDACRNQGSKSALGIELQPTQGIISFASCSPLEKSYEIERLGHGSFTLALLESLQIQGEGNCATVERLSLRLRRRVTEINQEHGFPKQTPYEKIEPSSKYHLIYLPDVITPTDSDIALLREKALEAEADQNLALAEQLWLRLVKHDHERALARLKRIWLSQSPVLPKPTPPSPPPVSKSPFTNKKVASASIPTKNGQLSVTDVLNSSLENHVQITEKNEVKDLFPCFYEVSPDIVCDYLSEENLKTRDYKTLEGDNDIYRASSPYLTLPISDNHHKIIFPKTEVSIENNIAYYVKGTQYQVDEIKLVLNVNHPESSEYVKNRLINITEILFKKSLNNTVPEVIKDAILQGNSIFQELEKADIEIVKINWPSRDGYEIQVKISKKNFTFIEILPGGVELELIKIPAGSFMMGSLDSDEMAYPDEKPQHRVNVKTFYMGQSPITQGQYEAVMGENPSYFKDKPNHPVESVSWHDTQRFCQKLSDKTGKKYRLPSEAEWEYACRAGTTTQYYFGDNAPQLGDYAWFESNSNGQTQPVGKKKPNPWGLYDVHGNVWEWCEDKWHNNYQKAPDNGHPWIQSGDSLRVLRGGSWSYNPWYCRAAIRFGFAPVFRNYNVGLRVVVSVP